MWTHDSSPPILFTLITTAVSVYQDEKCAENIKWLIQDTTTIFNSRKRLSAHKEVHKEADKEYNCEICGKVGKNGKFGYKTHKNITHGKKDKPCQYCQKCFNTDSQVAKHIAAVHIKPVLCNVCPKRFATKERLDCHVNSHHLGKFGDRHGNLNHISKVLCEGFISTF